MPHRTTASFDNDVLALDLELSSLRRHSFEIGRQEPGALYYGAEGYAIADLDDGRYCLHVCAHEPRRGTDPMLEAISAEEALFLGGLAVLDEDEIEMLAGSLNAKDNLPPSDPGSEDPGEPDDSDDDIMTGLSDGGNDVFAEYGASEDRPWIHGPDDDFDDC